jgi:hypothetical protein
MAFAGAAWLAAFKSVVDEEDGAGVQQSGGAQLLLKVGAPLDKVRGKFILQRNDQLSVRRP